MNKITLTTGILITLALVPTLVVADDAGVKTVQTNLDYIWNLVVGALIFFMKSRETI